MDTLREEGEDMNWIFHEILICRYTCVESAPGAGVGCAGRVLFLNWSFERLGPMKGIWTMYYTTF
jgi:nitrogenase subunit NifH